MVWGGFKYLEHYEIGLVFGLCRSRNKLADAYPSRIAETRFLAALDRSSRHHPWFAALGRHRLLGTRDRSTPGPAPPQPQGDRRPRTGHRHQRRPRRDRVLGLPAAGERLALRQRAGLRRRRARCGDRQLRGRDECRASRRSMAGGTRRRPHRYDVLGHRSGHRQRRRRPRRRDQRDDGHPYPPPSGVVQGDPPRRPVDHRLGPGPRLLRRRGSAVLRDPDGPSIGDRHDGHPSRRPRCVGDPGGPRLRARPGEQAACARRAAQRRRCHRRPLRSSRPGRRRRGCRRPRLDRAVPPPRRRGRPRPRRSSPCSAESSPTA